jgi:hypothetical protein
MGDAPCVCSGNIRWGVEIVSRSLIVWNDRTGRACLTRSQGVYRSMRHLVRRYSRARDFWLCPTIRGLSAAMRFSETSNISRRVIATSV